MLRYDSFVLIFDGPRGQLGVDERGLGVGVAQEMLDDGDIHPAVEGVAGEGMPHQMRMDAHGFPSPLPDLLERLLHRSGPHGLVRGPGGREQRLAAPPSAQVLLEHELGPDGEVDRPLLPALAQHHHAAALPVHRADPDAHQLAETAAGGHQELHQGLLLVGPAAVPEPLQLFRRQGPPGLRPVDLQGFDLPHRVLPDQVLHIQPAEEGAQGVDMGLDAGVLQAALREMPDVGPDVVRGDLGDMLVHLSGKGHEHLAVVLQRLRGQPVDLLGREERADPFFEIAPLPLGPPGDVVARQDCLDLRRLLGDQPAKLVQQFLFRVHDRALLFFCPV